MLLVDYNAWANGVVFRKSNEIKVSPHFLFYLVQCIWFYGEVVDPFGVKYFYRVIGMDLFESSTCSHLV